MAMSMLLRSQNKFKGKFKSPFMSFIQRAFYYCLSIINASGNFDAKLCNPFKTNILYGNLLNVFLVILQLRPHYQMYSGTAPPAKQLAEFWKIKM